MFKRNRKPFVDIINEFLNRDLILLSDESEYQNGNSILRFLCPRHPEKGEQTVTWRKLDGKYKYGCKHCGKDHAAGIFKHPFVYVKSVFESKGLTLLEENYINNNTHMSFVCPNFPREIQSSTFASLLKLKECCRLCGLLNRVGENHHRYKGGDTRLHAYLHRMIKPWKIDSMKSCGYKCIISEEDFDDIHHLYSFQNIIDETLNELNLPSYNQVNKYTEEELKLLADKCLEIHYRYPLGVCLTRKVHKEFHNIYTRQNNTPSQFYEFQRMKQAELNQLNQQVS